MLIYELSKPDVVRKIKKHLAGVTDGKWRYRVKDAFEEYGFQISGDGAYGFVAIRDDYPYALKIFHRDEGYMKWLDFCKTNQDNQYVPQLKGNMIHLGNDYYYIRMEKLTPIKSAGDLYFWISKDKKDRTNNFMSIWEIVDEFRRYQLETTDNHYLDEILDEWMQNKGSLDLHQGNFMKRSDGTPVFIDPYS